MHTTAAATPAQPSATLRAEAGTLAGEHDLLLRDVRQRADSVLALSSETSSWPHAELRELIERLLRMLEDHLIEEQAVLAALPEPPDPVPAVADLAAAAPG